MERTNDGTGGILRRVSWRELFPVLLLTRVPGAAVEAGTLLLATIAVWLLPLGWTAAEWMFLDDTARRTVIQAEGIATTSPVSVDTAHPEQARLLSNLNANLRGDSPGVFDWSPDRTANPHLWTARPFPPDSIGKWSGPWGPFAGVFSRLTRPVTVLIAAPITLRTSAYLLFGILWSIAVLAIPGAAIVRKAVVRLGAEQRAGLIESVRFALKRFFASFTAPILPALASTPFLIVLALIGLLLRWDVTAPAVGILWVLVIVIAFPMAMLVVGGLLAWPLMTPRIMAGNTDSFGAVSGAFAYFYGRPWRYLTYAVIAVFLGILAITVFATFMEALLYLTRQAVAAGSSAERIAELMSARRPGTVAGNGIAYGEAIVRSVIDGFALSYFLTASSAIYLLLRQDVDHEELDHIHFDEEERVLDPASPAKPAVPVVSAGSVKVDSTAGKSEDKSTSTGTNDSE